MKHRILLILGLFGLSLSLNAKILFISHNTPASKAVTQLVVDEYNYTNAYPGWFSDQTAAGESSSYATFQDTSLYLDETEIPDFENLLAARLAELGLQATDPADKGFTDLLASKGYEVVRSTGQEIENPDTASGETSFDNLQYARELTTALKEELNAYDLIIVSRDTGSGFGYSQGGRVAEGALVRIKAWNNLSAPIICMNFSLIAGSEFQFGWGWSYGFNFTNPSTVIPHVLNKDTGELGDPLSLVQEIHDSSDRVFDGINLPGDGIINIYDDTIFRSSSHRKFENNENFIYGLAVNNVLEYVVPNFIATDGTGTTLDIETKDPLILRLTPRRTLFTLQANFTGNFGDGVTVNSSDLAQRVIGPRLYFSAGMLNYGIYNLNSIGETMLLNAVSEFDTPSAIPDPVSPWEDVPAMNEAGDKETNIGLINDTHYPYVFHYGAGAYLYLSENSSLDSVYAFNTYDGFWLWTSDDLYGWHYNLGDSSYGLSGWDEWSF